MDGVYDGAEWGGGDYDRWEASVRAQTRSHQLIQICLSPDAVLLATPLSLRSRVWTKYGSDASEWADSNISVTFLLTISKS